MNEPKLWNTIHTQDTTSLNDVDTLTSNKKEEVFDICSESNNTFKKTKVRVYLLRHFPYIDTPEWREYEECLKKRGGLKWKIEEEGRNNKRIEELKTKIAIIREFKALSKEIQEIYQTIFAEPEKTALFFDMKTDWRGGITGNNIKKTFQNIWLIWHVDLPWSNQSDDIWYNDASKVTEIKKAFTDTINTNQWKYEIIVIIWNRSYANGFDILKSERDRDHEEREELFENQSYSFVDIDKTEKILRMGNVQMEITPHNMREVVLYLKEYEKFDVPASMPQTVQNTINELFFKKPQLFENHFKNPHVPYSLRTFSLANLIKNQEYTPIEDYYLTKCTNLSTEEKKLFLQNTEDPKIQSILQKLFVCKEVFWNDTDSQMFENHQQTPFYNVLKQSRTAYKNAQELQWKSLDPRIKLWGEKSILPRKFYYEEEEKEDASKGNTREEREQNSKTLVRKDFLPEMFFRDSGYPKYIIRGNVGDGKSVYLSDLAKQYAQESGKMVKFASAKDFDGKEAEITIFFNNPGAILCIDALDEAKAETKMAIVNAFRAFQGHCIMTTRYSELIETEKDTRTLHFHPLDSDVYIDSRFPDDQTKAAKVKEWLNTQGLATEVKGNPLLLNLIVLLAGATDTEMKWMKDYWILEYHQIKTKADLYDNVVRFVLAKHKEAISSVTILNVCMDTLAKYAFDIFSKPDEPPLVDENLFSKSLSILKRENGGNYEFIHKSFREFFLARHLAKMEKGQWSQEIYDFRDDKKTGNWNDWRDFRPVVLFYGEMLAKERRWKDLIEFLGTKGLMKWDHKSGENFFLGYEMLIKFQKQYSDNKTLQKLSRRHENIIWSWKQKDIIWKLTKLQEFMANTGYPTIEVIDGHIKDEFSRMFEKSGSNLANLKSYILGQWWYNKTIYGYDQEYDYEWDETIDIIQSTFSKAFLSKIDFNSEVRNLFKNFEKIGDKEQNFVYELSKIGTPEILFQCLELIIDNPEKSRISNFENFLIELSGHTDFINMHILNQFQEKSDFIYICAIFFLYGNNALRQSVLTYVNPRIEREQYAFYLVMKQLIYDDSRNTKDIDFIKKMNLYFFQNQSQDILNNNGSREKYDEFLYLLKDYLRDGWIQFSEYYQTVDFIFEKRRNDNSDKDRIYDLDDIFDLHAYLTVGDRMFLMGILEKEIVFLGKNACYHKLFESYAKGLIFRHFLNKENFSFKDVRAFMRNDDNFRLWWYIDSGHGYGVDISFVSWTSANIEKMITNICTIILLVLEEKDSKKKDRDRIIEVWYEDLIIRPAFELLWQFLERNPEQADIVVNFVKKNTTEKELVIFLQKMIWSKTPPLQWVFESLYWWIAKNEEIEKIQTSWQYKTISLLDVNYKTNPIINENKVPYISANPYTSSKYFSILWDESFINRTYWDCLYFSRRMMELPIYIEK